MYMRDSQTILKTEYIRYIALRVKRIKKCIKKIYSVIHNNILNTTNSTRTKYEQASCKKNKHTQPVVSTRIN